MKAEYKKVKDKHVPWRITLKPETKFENRTLRRMVIRNPLGITWFTPDGGVLVTAEPRKKKK